MNWTEIKKKYPKAWDKLFEMFNEGILEDAIEFEGEVVFLSDIIKFEDNQLSLYSRILYDFFDENGIVVNTPTLLTTTKLKWGWHIGKIHKDKDDLDSIGYYSDRYFWTSRTEAEAEAFNKAFEILEEKL